MLVTTRYGLEIRAAAPIDAPGLLELFAAVGLAAEARDLAERLVAIRDAPGTALIATQWGPPSGLVVLHWYPTLDDARPTAQITTLLVAIEDRRRGIGRLLLKAAAQAARTAGCGKLELTTGLDEASLHAFCRATGFAEAGPRFVRSLRKGA
ncbi:GNAT family N-acetyltransferase [Falsiroseomonas oryzae]|uniref:GNAT family N-acetyltransferase n=1 Tax=Falsiroseomonas oryzae TaxID=2766473 RepID=UPI0022EB9D2D|nr:GNAT family N-acetyltransferase [Roseomonas sp. MO-31]